VKAGVEKRPARQRSDARYAPRDPGPASRARRGLLSWRRANRRITVEQRSPLLWLSQVIAAIVRRLLVVVKILAAVGALGGVLYLGRLGVAHVVASPRFALRQLRIDPSTHLTREQIAALTGVSTGDRLITLDTDAVAARLAAHPWIASARVRRELPSTLVINLVERRAAAVALMGGPYLVDESGHAFKPATLDETDGLVVLTGVSREQYAGLREVSESAFHEALALNAAYQHPDSLATARAARTRVGRPPLSEIHIDPRNGFSLFLYEGGGEIRLGRSELGEKLARLDEILAALGPRGVAALRVLHLDGPVLDRVPLKLAPAPGTETPPPVSPGASTREVKKSTPSRNPVISGSRASTPVPMRLSSPPSPSPPPAGRSRPLTD
jgi:cell division septal protein FtsQ